VYWLCAGVIVSQLLNEILADEMLEIADGELDDDNPLPEDIARSKLKIETRRFLIAVNNRRNWGCQEVFGLWVDQLCVLVRRECYSFATP
jgi:hypothetical protein